MYYKAKIIQQTFNIFKKYLQQHLTHSYHLRPMINYIKNTHPTEELFGIEIGTHQALNAYSIMQNLPIRKLCLIDPYELYDDGINDYKNRSKDFEIAQQRMKPFKSKIEFVKKSSEEAYKDFLPGPYESIVDFIYIDGNHSYNYVKQDINLYYPLVKSGGVIGGHDFRADCEGLCRAVLEFVDKNNLKLNGWVTDWWVVKP